MSDAPIASRPDRPDAIRPDVIELRGLRAVGYCGALPEEQERAQPFEVDLDVEADLSGPGRTDRLEDTLDYGAIAAAVEQVITTERFALLERLSARIAEVVLTDPRAAAVTVTVRKLRPPVPQHLETSGVRIPAHALVRAFLGLGSNLGDREAYLRDAVGSLSGVTAVSPVYETDPVGGPGGQEAYLNIVVELDTDLSPHALLGVCHRLESAAGRVREERWGPRTLDVDLLWVESGPVNDPDLVIPHPRMAERRFVMAPLADLAPDVVPDDWNDRAEGRVRRVGPLKP